MADAINSAALERGIAAPPEPAPVVLATTLPEPLLKKWAEQASVMSYVCYRVAERELARHTGVAYAAIALSTLGGLANAGSAFMPVVPVYVRVATVMLSWVTSLLIISKEFFQWQKNSTHNHMLALKFSNLSTLLQVVLAGGDEPEGHDARRLLTEFQALENQMACIPDSIQTSLRQRFGGTRSIPTVAGGIPTIAARR